jgi:hypothetical protein
MKEISIVTISLKVEDKAALFILLAKDGTVNRLGTGSENNTENDLYIAVDSSGLFEKLARQISPELLELKGEYKSYEIKGKACQLVVGFGFADGTQDGSLWIYGTQSAGPPPEITNFVISAVELTEPWFEEQKKAAKG